MPRKKILVAVAWPYANGAIHMGHMAGCYLPPDIFTRYHRMRGNRVLMVSGSDEHGTPITVTAEEEGVSPETVAKRYHRVNMDSLLGMGVFYPHEDTLFTETSTENHKEVVQDLFLRLKENGHIFLREMISPYCPKCQRFLPDRYVEGVCPHCDSKGARGDQCDSCGKTLDPVDLILPTCKKCGTAPEMRTTEHFFLRLSAFEEKLLAYTEDKEHWRQNTKRFTENWLRSGLKDRPITRDIKWGVPIPLEGYEDKRIYVWFEAVTGYLSAPKEWALHRGEPSAWEEFWKDPECKHYYFLGKDNIPFHSIIWPAMLTGYGGLELPYDVVANEYMHFKGEKLSKSRGNVVSVQDYLAHLPPDHLRYYLTANAPENRDSEFTWDDLITRVNEELVSTLGNFVHRVITFTAKNFGEIPEQGALSSMDEEVLAEAKKKTEEVAECIEGCHFKDGMKSLMELARAGNVYLDRSAPWKSLKEDKARCATSLHVSLRLVKALAVAGYPFMPHAMERLWESMGQPGGVGDEWSPLSPLAPAKLEKPEVLFKKLAPEDIAPIMGGRAMEHLDLRIGNIVDVEDHPNADKLYVLHVDLGDETRTLVAGLRPYYSIEEMKGRQIVVVTNLKPAKLRGVESRGMLLAADDGKGKVSLLSPSSPAPPGTSVDGCKKGAPIIGFDEFLSSEITIEETKDGKRVVFHGPNDIPLQMANGASIMPDVDMPPGAKVR